MYWLEVSVVVDGEGAEAVAEALRPFAYGNGVVLEQRGDASKPDPDALEPEVTVKIFLPEEQDVPLTRNKIEESLYYLGRLYPIPPPTFKILQDDDWANAWRRHYHPIRIGQRIWIRPSWLEATESQVGDVVVAIDPGMAFGTGLHPSTQMCLQQLEELVEPGMSVMDVGTGSGILSAAAVKLGARQVLAFDTDYLAVVAARDNVARNGVSENVDVFQGELSALRTSQWDLVVVNILAPVIIHLLRRAKLADYLGRQSRVILSGIIEEQESEVTGALAEVSLEVTHRLAIRDWLCLTAQRMQKRHPRVG